jgi:hypothetical protein
LSPISEWKKESTGYVVRVKAVKARPNQRECTVIDKNYDEHFAFRGNLIQSLVSNKAPAS